MICQRREEDTGGNLSVGDHNGEYAVEFAVFRPPCRSRRNCTDTPLPTSAPRALHYLMGISIVVYAMTAKALAGVMAVLRPTNVRPDRCLWDTVSARARHR